MKLRHPYRRLARALGAAACLALAAGPTARAGTDRSGFEADESCEWSGPWGGGMDGGAGKGDFVTPAPGDFVRSGKRALRLSVWDNGASNATGWAFLAQKLPCASGARVRAGASFYASSSVLPVPSGAVAQLRLEYYYDQTCESQIPTHVMLSEPFSLADGRQPDVWHAVEVRDRVPDGATCLKFSIVLLARRPGRVPGAIWVDDTFVDLARGRNARAREATPEMPAVTPATVAPRRSWWQRLFR